MSEFASYVAVVGEIHGKPGLLLGILAPHLPLSSCEQSLSLWVARAPTVLNFAC